MAKPKKRPKNKEISFNNKIYQKFETSVRPVTPEDRRVKYAVDKPTERERLKKNIFLTFWYAVYIFCGGVIFMVLEGLVCNYIKFAIFIFF